MTGLHCVVCFELMFWVISSLANLKYLLLQNGYRYSFIHFWIFFLDKNFFGNVVQCDNNASEMVNARLLFFFIEEHCVTVNSQ